MIAELKQADYKLDFCNNFLQINPGILIIDDEPMVRESLVEVFESMNYYADSAENGINGLKKISSNLFAIAIIDINLPDYNGIELLKQIKKISKTTEVIIISGTTEMDTAVNMIKSGASDYLAKPFSIHDAEFCIFKTMEKYKIRSENINYQENLELLVKQRTIELQTALQEINFTYNSTIKSLGAVLDLRDEDTQHHCERVEYFSLKIAEKMGITDEEKLRDIKWGAYLHDIGKIGIPDAILFKKEKLTDDEMEIMKNHTKFGYRLVGKIPFLQGAADLILHHHESYDGHGYPDGLKGIHIPLSARIFAAADTIDAMLSDRTYRKALTFDSVSDELQKLSGIQFDPEVVNAFLIIPKNEWR